MPYRSTSVARSSVRTLYHKRNLIFQCFTSGIGCITKSMPKLVIVQATPTSMTRTRNMRKTKTLGAVATLSLHHRISGTLTKPQAFAT